jgi:hypothetical protein
MEKEIEKIRIALIDVIKIINSQNWNMAIIELNFAPNIGRSYSSLLNLFDKEENRLDYRFRIGEVVEKLMLKFIVKHNQNSEYNTITFTTKKEDSENATIAISFNQQVEDDFQNCLPKSKRGKTIPWWKNENETKDLQE